MPSLVEITKNAVEQSGKDITVPKRLTFEQAQKILAECGYDLVYMLVGREP